MLGLTADQRERLQIEMPSYAVSDWLEERGFASEAKALRGKGSE